MEIYILWLQIYRNGPNRMREKFQIFFFISQKDHAFDNERKCVCVFKRRCESKIYFQNPIKVRDLINHLDHFKVARVMRKHANDLSSSDHLL